MAYLNLHTCGFSETGCDAALSAKADAMDEAFWLWRRVIKSF
jgi:uncharacterized protein with beta-barrel porin domain